MDCGSEELVSSPEESCDEKVSAKVVTSCSRSKRFTAAQRACLKVYYANGMTRTDKKHAAVIARAADDTGLTTKQVKV